MSESKTTIWDRIRWAYYGTLRFFGIGRVAPIIDHEPLVADEPAVVVIPPEPEFPLDECECGHARVEHRTNLHNGWRWCSHMDWPEFKGYHVTVPCDCIKFKKVAV